MHADLHKIAVVPIPARLVNKIVLFAGNNFAELFLYPSFVIRRRLPTAYICSPSSAGEYQSISPSQYEGLLVSGVPPPIISAISPSLRCSQAGAKITSQSN